jgi:beta-lactamase class D
MGSVQYEEVIELALQLSPAEQARLMEQLAVSVRQALSDQADEDQDIPAWTPEEIAEMLKPEPKTGAEIVAAGLIGGWADLNIEDGAEWVNARKRQRKEQLRW